MFNFYGFFISLGILVGVLVVQKIKERREKIKSFIWLKSIDIYQTLTWILLPGIMGARLYHVWDYWRYYQENLVEILFVWQGGLGIFGGVLGGMLGLYAIMLKSSAVKNFFSNRTRVDSSIPKRQTFKKTLKYFLFSSKIISNLENNSQRRDAINVKKENFKHTLRIIFRKTNKKFFQMLDLGVVGLAIGQAIGRWGNFFNQELYGWPTNLPWGIYIRPENRLPGLERFTHFHPLFLYESIGCMIIFFLLFCFARQQIVIRFSNRRRRKLRFLHKVIGVCCKHENFLKFVALARKPGFLFFLYLFLYSLLRFFLEFLRPEGWQTQICSLKYIRVTHIITSLTALVSLLALVKIFVTIKKEQK